LSPDSSFNFFIILLPSLSYAHHPLSSVAAASTVNSLGIRVKCKIVLSNEVAKDFIVRSNHPASV
ncbi:MAG: hypothetical protein ACK56I_28980, partial [bacterium]